MHVENNFAIPLVVSLHSVIRILKRHIPSQSEVKGKAIVVTCSSFAKSSTERFSPRKPHSIL